MENQRKFPCITIEYCTQCKWLLRAAYFAQELLSTFSTTVSEVALIPSTGGSFVIKVFDSPDGSGGGDHASMKTHTLWDRRTDGGFPETKELKRRVRDIIDPARNLGHVDGHPSTTAISSSSATVGTCPSHSSKPQLERLPSSLGELKAGTTKFKAISRLQEGQTLGFEETGYSLMDVDIGSRLDSSGGIVGTVYETGTAFIAGEQGFELSRPCNEDCG